MNFRLIQREDCLFFVFEGPKERQKLIPGDAFGQILKILFSPRSDAEKIVEILSIEGGFRVEELAMLLSRKKSYIYELLGSIPVVSKRDKYKFACYSLGE